ncbi:MAG: hypothetical protein KDH94_05960 [Coxiellaceae bacterium]|nr:hypothetical protein [Coxiellaceae bacterium]
MDIIKNHKKYSLIILYIMMFAVIGLTICTTYLAIYLRQDHVIGIECVTLSSLFTVLFASFSLYTDKRAGLYFAIISLFVSIGSIVTLFNYL